MGILETFGITEVYHFAPLHYLPFIARAGALSSKPALLKAGFSPSHFRSMSHRQDSARGFDECVHLTLAAHPPIVEAKLAAGFPHVRLSVPVNDVEAVDFALCRYNIAMTRYLRRNGTPGFPESPTNGRYYDQKQIPVAKATADKRAMLEAHLSRTMIEVLVPDTLPLPEATLISCYSQDDEDLALKVLHTLQRPWDVVPTKSPTPYNRNEVYATQVLGFIDKALKDPTWLGDGLEFDRV